MEKLDKKRSERRNCGTCRWYDHLGDLCRNRRSPRDWDLMDPREGCRKWERDE